MLVKRKFSSIIGSVTIYASDEGVHAVSLDDYDETPAHFSKATEAKSHPVLDLCYKELQEYFEGKRLAFTVPLMPEGTDFQKKVWTALKKIPYGKTESYSEQARRMKKPLSVRAVAAANGRNPIAIIIPCHRVIASTGHLHGYAGGLDLKCKLLEIEGLKIENYKIHKGT